jgi:sugar O-acyltransferase (sialic acid O-acetyltransferase NeuD family)
MTAPIPVVVLGAGGTAEDVVEFLNAPDGMSGYSCVAVLDDDASLLGQKLSGATVEGPLADVHHWPDAYLVDTLGSPRGFRKRPDIIAALSVSDERFLTVVHPQATVSPSATLGQGCIVYPHTLIGPGVTLGAHVIALSHSAINHHGHVGDFSILASHVALGGRVQVGRCCYLGMGSTVIQDGAIGDEVLVGMGSVVLRDIPPGTVVAGNPAAPIAAGADGPAG